jgi:hypothetical protein
MHCVILCALQGGSEKLSDEAIEETLEKVVKLLAYISDKDLFAEFYRKRLARRLLQVRFLCFISLVMWPQAAIWTCC